MASPPPRPKHPNLSTYHLTICFLLASTITSTTAASTSYSSACPSLAPAADRHTDADDAHSLASSFQIYNAHSSGGHSSYHSFSLSPDRAARTSDPTLVHLAATLDLSDPHRRSLDRNGTIHGFVSFVLDGYYSSTSLELCMVGSTSSATTADDVFVLRLRVPSPPTLTDPFMTGTLEGSSDLGLIQLVAYAQGDDYEYGNPGRDSATCSPSAAPPLQALGVGGDIPACAHLVDQLVTSYRLDHHQGGGAPARLPRWMYINQMHCAADGAVRAYVVFSNDTCRRAYDGFMVAEEAAVAEGRWDRARGMLCLTACRVVGSASNTQAVGECGLRMSFWFQAVWTVRDCSVVAGMLWNTSTGAGDDSGGPFYGVNLVSALSIDDPAAHRRRNLSEVRYEYSDTMLEEAKKHYLTINKDEKMKGSFPVPGDYDTYRDLCLRFFGTNTNGSGAAFPVAIGSVMMSEDAADDSFFRHAVAGAEHGQLLSVSYDIQHYALLDGHRVPPPNNSHSPRLKRQQIKAEGVYDAENGILCMVGCREHGCSTDCRILVTVQFPPLEHGHGGRGTISSFRDRADPLFFEQSDIVLYGMYSEQLSGAVSRLDLESVMLVASAMLSCVFAAVQILHTKRNPEASPATSVTMLAVLVLGYLAPLALSFETLFASRRRRYGLADNSGWLELNQVMVNVPPMVAFVLHMRLLLLAFSGRWRSVAADQSKPVVMTSESTVLKICLPLYLLGAVLAAAIHAASEMGLMVVLDDLVSYTGLIVDGFLLPQVILNASGCCSTVVVQAISPWFYMGGTVIRVMPHVYDLVRRQVYAQSMRPSDVYASPRVDLFGVAWDIVVPCAAASLALMLFWQQRLRVEGAV